MHLYGVCLFSLRKGVRQLFCPLVEGEASNSYRGREWEGQLCPYFKAMRGCGPLQCQRISFSQ